MPLIEVRRAIYAYASADGDELAMSEGDVLYIVDNADPDWLQAKRKALNVDDPEEQGLVPANHTELVEPVARARALYDYEPAQDEETTLAEGEEVQIIEDDDPDWFMARSKGGCGFVPRAYVELVPDATKEPEHELVSVAPVLPPPLPALPPQQPPPLPPVPPPVVSTPEETAPTPPSPALPSLPPPPPRATLQQTLQTLESMLPPPPPPPPQQQPQPQPQLATTAPAAKPASTISHFNVVLGKKKKGRRVTLGISNQELIIDEHDDTAAPRKFATGDIAKCTAKKTVVTVTIDGTEFDFLCASAAETERVADAIGAARRGMFIGDRVVGGGSRNDESLLPPPPPPPKDNSIALMSPPPPPRPAPQEYAVVLYSFSSNDAEELDVDEGARVLVLDRSDVEWWKVQLAPPHGRTGLVPASYLELQAGGSGDGDSRRSIAVDSTPPLPTRTDTLRSAMARTGNEPAALNAAVAGRTRGASLRAETPLASAFDKSPDSDNIPLHSLQQRQAATATAAAAATATLAGPEAHKMRKWTDGTGTYTVDAAFVRLDADGTVHLHKTNNKQISVALAKFSPEDQRYVAGLTGSSGQQPAKALTARQRQQEQARATPGRRIINYDWDWFDFFTLKCGVVADSALKYSTAFVAERLDDESIPELTADYMCTLGVKPDDIPRIERAFRIHRGLQVDAAEPLKEARSSFTLSPHKEGRSSSTPSPLGNEPPLATEPPPQAPRRANNDPWGVESELDRRVGRYKQIESDEAFARELQKSEEDRPRRGRDRKLSIKQKVLGRRPEAPAPPAAVTAAPADDPFDLLAAQPAPQRTENKQPLNLGVGSRKTNRSQTSFVDPAQLRPAHHRLGSPVTSPGITSPVSVGAGSPRMGSFFSVDQQQQQQQQQASARVRPTARHVQQQPSVGSAAGLGDLTTNTMAAAAASGNTAQVSRLEQLAIAKAQELAVQEAHIKRQQEEVRKQAQLLQQQQQQLLQMQQTQKVEAQLKQLRDENDRLEKQRQTEQLQSQIVALKAQQDQMLKMQQMASQVRSSAQQPIQQPLSGANMSGMATGMATPITPMAPVQQQQQQQQQIPLSRRLPPPLVPTRISKPLTPQPGQVPFGLPQQQQQLGRANLPMAAGMFGTAQGVANLPAASSSTTGLAPASAVSGMFGNQGLTGSTPNLGAFASSGPGPSALGSFGAPSVGMSQFVPQQHMLTMGTTPQMGQPTSKYDLFRSVNPHAPSIFSGAPLQQPQMQMQPQGMPGTMPLQVSAAFPGSASQHQRPSGPTGIFAMPNPTLTQHPQQQQQQQQQQPSMMANFQQQQQQLQHQQQQMFGAQPQWR